MTKEQKDNITKKLIPFILREQGRGFAMGTTLVENVPGLSVICDGIRREVPRCDGTVACIGGSLKVLFGSGSFGHSMTEYGISLLGLSEGESHSLFYGWKTSWPSPFRQQYARAKTPLGKARVAARLLKKIAKEGKLNYVGRPK